MNESLSSRLARARCVFLDCDGVIFDSNGFKLKAMLEVLDGYPEAARLRMAEYWKENGGMSRRTKFEYFFQEIVPVDDAPSRIERVLVGFHELAVKGYETMNPLPSALELARRVGPARTFVVSGADQAELRAVFRDKAIVGLFADVLGAPTPKLDLVRQVLQRVGATPDEALLVGDGSRDFEVCRALGVHFVYLAEYSDWKGASAALSGADNVTRAPDWPWLLEAFGFASAGSEGQGE